METFVYKPSGVCAKQIEIDTDGEIVGAVRFVGGCSGNTQGVASLCKGMNMSEVINRLSGIKCGVKSTSCPDQLAKALAEIQEKSEKKVV